MGTSQSTGTKLLSLDSYFNQPGIYEVPMGFSLKEVIYDLAGGFRKPVKALHIGGPLGGLIPLNKIDTLDISFESFRTQGFLLGHASVICIPEEMPILQYLQHLLTFAAHESCGKCFPCQLGSQRQMDILDQIANQGAKNRYMFGGKTTVPMVLRTEGGAGGVEATFAAVLDSAFEPELLAATVLW